MSNFKQFFILLTLVLILSNTNKGIAQSNIRDSKQIPVLGWYSISPGQTTLARYKELKQAGITLSFTFFPDVEFVEKALKVAHEAGLKIIIPCSELRSETEKSRQKLHALKMDQQIGKQ